MEENKKKNVKLIIIIIAIILLIVIAGAIYIGKRANTNNNNSSIGDSGILTKKDEVKIVESEAKSIKYTDFDNGNTWIWESLWYWNKRDL